MIYFMFLISVFFSFVIGLGLGGRGSNRMKMINYGVIILFIVTIIQFLISIKLGFLILISDVIILYGTAYFFNRKFHGLDQINNQVEAENYKKRMENILNEK